MELTEPIKETAERLKPDTSAIGFFVILMVAQIFCYINFQGEGFSRDVALAYIIIPVALLTAYFAEHGLTRRRITLDKLNLLWMVVWGCVGFIATMAFVNIVYGRLLGVQFGSVPVTGVAGAFVTQLLFVACSEELAFRYILPAYLREKFPKAKVLPYVMASITFASFHMAAYSGNYRSMALAFMVALVWFFLYEVNLFTMKLGGEKKLGLGFTIGSHAAYNLTLLGVLSGGIELISGGM